MEQEIVLIETIHDSLVNGNRRQMVKQIQEYGLYDFWSDYKDWLDEFYCNEESAYAYFSEATMSYFRITNR